MPSMYLLTFEHISCIELLKPLPFPAISILNWDSPPICTTKKSPDVSHLPLFSVWRWGKSHARFPDLWDIGANRHAVAPHNFLVVLGPCHPPTPIPLLSVFHMSLHQKFQLVPEDLKYLKSQLLENAIEKLNRDLPRQTSTADDPLRRRVTEFIEAFVDETFELTKYSMIVNGQDISHSASLKRILSSEIDDEAIEPFDKELNRKLRELYTKVDNETLAVTEMRKKIPQYQAESYKDAITQHEKLMADVVNKTVASSDIGQGISQEDRERLIRLENQYKDIQKRLKGLQTSVPDVYTELEQLQETLTVLKAKTAAGDHLLS